MEQHIENLFKTQLQRESRRLKLELEMSKTALSETDQEEVRKLLFKKESNHIRLKRAKMDRSMFKKIRTIGVGAFGEVALVEKTDANMLYALKIFRKADVLKLIQVAHVKAERDILAEAYNERVVRLYYSFQDDQHLYFVIDYIPGGDLMSLLIKHNLFDENLARFYIAELVLAVESVHKMGFIHRDIKPDNVLIDKDGHIKLTDFGLCTGFCWTHNSKYYHHERANSMDFESAWNNNNNNNANGNECLNGCNCPHAVMNGAQNGSSTMTASGMAPDIFQAIVSSKPLERRKQRREHNRCLAHSMVGKFNYIAPEVLLCIGYTQLCDWWSVCVIMYEMVEGPFFANTPEETEQKVINWPSTLRIPVQVRLSSDTSDLITQLCCDAQHRIGLTGADQMKRNPSFDQLTLSQGCVLRLIRTFPRSSTQWKRKTLIQSIRRDCTQTSRTLTWTERCRDLKASEQMKMQ